MKKHSKEKVIYQEKKKSKSSGKLLHILVLFLSIFILSPLIALLALYVVFLNKIYPNIHVDGVAIGNKTVEEASTAISGLENKIPDVIILKYKEKSWNLALKDVSYYIRPRETAIKAYKFGRGGSAVENIQELYKGVTRGSNIELDYLVDTKSLESKLSNIFTEVFSPAIDPKIDITLDNKTGKKVVNVSAGQEGMELDKEKALSIINGRLSSFNFSPIELPINPINPAFGKAQIEKTKARAEGLLGKTLILTFEDFSWTLNDSEVIDFLDFDGSYSTEKIANFANSISSSIERSPQNASFQFADNKVTLFRPAIDGVALDTGLFTERVVESLENLEKSEEKISISIPVSKKTPEVTTESVNNLGIKELIGRGYSTFKGSIQSRVHNIVLASSKINGALIKPGDTFSFNKTLGDVSAATGFQQAYIIKEGRTVLGDGGGVCQVSSTLFRAALNAGLPIEERWPHSYRVSYYEQGFGPGLDATVFDPSYDLKLRNDTAGYILIQAYTDTNNLKLTFDLYGTSDGRVAKITPPKIWSETPPPPDLYQDDPTLPVGTVKQVDWKAWGAKVSFDYKVTRGNETLQQKTFYSNYSPWRAIFLKGTRP